MAAADSGFPAAEGGAVEPSAIDMPPAAEADECEPRREAACDERTERE